MEKSRRSRWAIFAWLYAGLSVIALIALVGRDDSVSIFAWGNIAISVVGIIPLFGLGYSRPIANRSVWLLYVLIELLAVVSAVVLVWIPAFMAGELISFPLTWGFTVSFTLAALYGHVLYVFFRKGLWREV